MKGNVQRLISELMQCFSGITMQTEFMIECSDWKDDDSEDSSDRLSYILSDRGSTSHEAFSQTGLFQFLILRPGDRDKEGILALQVLITDNYGDTATFYVDVQVWKILDKV